MMKNNSVKMLLCLLVLVSVSAPVFAQRARSKPFIFAVMNDGTQLEPIAFIEKGKLTSFSEGDVTMPNFHRNYYKPNTVYNLIFAGVNAGSVTVKSSNPKSDCAASMATATVVSAKAKLKGNVRALATSAAVKKGTGVRRLPTPAERAEIEALVRAELIKNSISETSARNLKYHNLTALDIDADKTAELVGSFWVEPTADSRALLFFIAEKQANGKYAFTHSDFSDAGKDDVMSGEVKDLDEGIGHELLLDVFDTDGDGRGEIFTYTQSFEGAHFHAYQREKGKWTKIFEAYNYRCAY